MKKEKIGNILQMQRGYDLPVSQMRNGQTPVVGSNGVIGYHDTAKCITPTITIGRSGSAGKIHMYDTPTWVHNTALYLTDFKGNNPKYLYYLLQLLHLESLCGSSVIPSLNRNVVYPMVVNFHENREDQDAISSILSKIDEKIAVNREINRNLEAMARQLYDYWFVQFDFPDENGKPYKSSGGKMVWNEKIKHEIPEGWSDTTLGIFCNMYQPKTIGTNELDENGAYLVYGANGIVGRYYTYNHTESEIAMACRGNSCGVVNRTRPYSWITGNAMVIRPNDSKVHNEYVRQAIHYMNIGGAISGSGQPQLTRENLSSVRMCSPIREILYKYSVQVSSIVDLQLSVENEIENLKKQRDELLPLLMNGQVSVMPSEVNCDLSLD
ncbi:restriction endonuclease subunit S [uncultured Duncaniella sp.]|uniref:restriction endonuclease subunit S n=3 Tax=Muribaculaceae TaxID=2005473 RepID=UPI0025A242A9|nr:restriction endonuclease subunit S [Bacteroides intestinalis]